MTLNDLLIPLDRLFYNERIGYAVIGAYAVAAWGEIRATKDIDLLIEESDVSRLEKVLESEGFRYESRKGDPEDPINYVLRVGAESGEDFEEIDILAGIRGAPGGILERAQLVQLRNISVPVASPEDTIILKLLAGSMLDMEDIQSILRAQGDRLSRSLLRVLCPAALKEKLETILA